MARWHVIPNQFKKRRQAPGSDHEFKFLQSFPADNRPESWLSEISAEDIYHQLSKILNSRTFADAQRLKEFLKYIVSQAIAGRGGEIKEYTIAVEVFGKSESFDSRIDPIVRVEASRLRSKLRTYRYKEGKSDPLVIELPRRGYKPIVRPAISSKKQAGINMICSHETAIAVLPFLIFTGSQDTNGLGQSLTEDLADKLMDIPGVWVLPTTISFRFKDNPELIYKIGKVLGMLLLVEASMQVVHQKIRVRARLINIRDSMCKRLGSYDAELENEVEIDKILRAITSQIAQAVSRASS